MPEAAHELQKDIAAAQIDAQSSGAAHEQKHDELTSLISIDAADYPAPLAFAGRFSDRANTGLGLRYHAEKDLDHADNSESTPAPESHLAYRRRGDRLRRHWIFSTL